mgnify:CR=1 FL=1
MLESRYLKPKRVGHRSTRFGLISQKHLTLKEGEESCLQYNLNITRVK